MTNIEVMNAYNVKRIVTTCPHSYNTLKNEYPSGELGWGEDVALKNVLDYNDIELQLTYLKYFHGDINREIDKNINHSNRIAWKA